MHIFVTKHVLEQGEILECEAQWVDSRYPDYVEGSVWTPISDPSGDYMIGRKFFYAGEWFLDYDDAVLDAVNRIQKRQRGFREEITKLDRLTHQLINSLAKQGLNGTGNS